MQWRRFGAAKPCRFVAGTCSGIGLLFLATVTLWWNEGVAVTTARSLAEGLENVIPVRAQSTLDSS
jgi:hypothetical protein